MRALLSVYDKHGIVDFARGLVGLGFEVVSTGGTLAALRESGVDATAVADVTGFPEILDGRVKTLHPAIHGGLLARRDHAADGAQLQGHGISPIDLLAVNLYPFAATIARPDATFADAIEQIDIGGPAMLRAAAKNHASVVVLVDPRDYEPILSDLLERGIDQQRRCDLAAKAFAHVAAYDTVVADYLRCDQTTFPSEFSVAGRHVATLRYGENPQQRGAAYRRLSANSSTTGVLDAAQLGGKALSFNNLLDADAAWTAAIDHEEPTAAIVKHTIPCGLATRATLADAFAAALAGDPVSAFGGIVALNRSVDEETAERIAAIFFEVIAAPGFDPPARALLAERKNLRLLAMPEAALAPGVRRHWDVRPIRGGLLVQDQDDAPADPATWRVVTRRHPTEQQRIDLEFAWRAVRHVKSNAIVLVRDQSVVGVGSGQPNRLESVRIAGAKAGDRAKGAVLASDAFFPFADGVEEAAGLGVAAIVQPGGSVHDAETIDAADAAGISMSFTGVRHFRH